MKDTTTLSELSELITFLDALPPESQEAFKEAFERASQHLDRRRRILQYIQEALSQLRLDMKYLMFDLEATRRERDELKRQLDEK